MKDGRILIIMITTYQGYKSLGFGNSFVGLHNSLLGRYKFVQYYSKSIYVNLGGNLSVLGISAVK